MKKLIFTLVAVALGLAANAQYGYVFGGSIGMSAVGGRGTTTNTISTTTTTYVLPSDRTVIYSLLPKVGMVINRKLDIGAYFGVVSSAVTNYSIYSAEYASVEGFEGWQKTVTNSWKVAPYMRYKLYTSGKFSIFTEAQLLLSGNPAVYTHQYHTDIPGIGSLDEEGKATSRSFAFGLDVVPGMNYKVNEKISVDLYVDLARLSFTSTRTTDDQSGTDWSKREVSVFNNFSIGADASAQSLTQHLDWFRVGFNYHL